MFRVNIFEAQLNLGLKNIKKSDFNWYIFTCGRQHRAHCTLHTAYCTLHTASSLAPAPAPAPIHFIILLLLYFANSRPYMRSSRNWYEVGGEQRGEKPHFWGRPG